MSTGKRNEIVYSAENGMLEDNEWTVAEYIEYLRDMSPADFRKYYGHASIDEAERILLAREQAHG